MRTDLKDEARVEQRGGFVDEGEIINTGEAGNWLQRELGMQRQGM